MIGPDFAAPRFLALTGIMKIMNSVAFHGTATASQNCSAYQDGNDAHEISEIWNQARIWLETTLCETKLWIWDAPCALEELRANRRLLVYWKLTTGKADGA